MSETASSPHVLISIMTPDIMLWVACMVVCPMIALTAVGIAYAKRGNGDVHQRCRKTAIVSLVVVLGVAVYAFATSMVYTLGMAASPRHSEEVVRMMLLTNVAQCYKGLSFSAAICTLNALIVVLFPKERR